MGDWFWERRVVMTALVNDTIHVNVELIDGRRQSTGGERIGRRQQVKECNDDTALCTGKRAR